MERITFSHVMPHVFASGQAPTSELWGQEVTFHRGQLYLIEAESGKGKSTFCSYVSGYRNDYNGVIRFDDTDVRTLGIDQWTRIRQSHISLLFQELRLFPELTALENVDIKNRLTHHKPRTEIMEWFERLGLQDKMHKRVGQLSFGQQQRVALMRALSQPFDVLLADEPISHLDDANAHAMGQLMVQEARLQGAAIVVTSIGKHLPLDYDTVVKL